MKNINEKRPFKFTNPIRRWRPHLSVGMASRAIIIVVAVIIVIGFSAMLSAYINRIRAGYIIDKRYEPAHYEEYMTYYTNGDKSIPVYRHRYIPDNWSFVIRDNDETARWDVYESTYNKYNVGDWFDVDVEGEKALW